MSDPSIAPPQIPLRSAPNRSSWAIRVMKALFGFVALAGLAFGGCLTQDRWMPILFPGSTTEPETSDHSEAAPPSEQVTLSNQAQKNLKLTAKPLKIESFWKTISVPGMVIDRPGYSDRGVVAPVTGVVSRIHKVAGDSARPGEVMFTLKLLSESLHQTQTELFKASKDIKLAQAQLVRLKDSAGAISEARIIEVENQITRLEVSVKAYRQELLNRGLPAEQIDRVAEGNFVNELPIMVPTRTASTMPGAVKMSTEPLAFEVQELKVELGQQVQAGQMLCQIANHQLLAIEGRAFRDESPLIERVVKEGWPIEVDFGEESTQDWPPLKQTFSITYMANSIDPDSRTFRFLMPLDNQSRAVEKDGRSQTLWRFRPGQRVRLLVRVDQLTNVFVLPTDAVARDGAETYVFRQNGDSFDRKPVHVVYQDRQNAVIANDGSVSPGVYVVQTGAAQLNRMIKSQSGTLPKGFHIHADGSVHMGNH